MEIFLRKLCFRIIEGDSAEAWRYTSLYTGGVRYLENGTMHRVAKGSRPGGYEGEEGNVLDLYGLSEI
jgi:hypothetical protein